MTTTKPHIYNTPANVTKKKARLPRGLTITLTIAAALSPLFLFFIPGVHQFVTDSLDIFFTTEGTSYSPTAPLEFYVGPGEAWIPLSATVMVFAVLPAMVSGLMGHGVLWVLERPTARRREVENVPTFTACAVFVLAIVATIVIFAIGPPTQHSLALDARGAQVAEWAEGRYGMSLDAATAEALVQQSRQAEGSPVLVEGRLLNLTRVAQGGYVLTEDGSATELPTEH